MDWLLADLRVISFAINNCNRLSLDSPYWGERIYMGGRGLFWTLYWLLFVQQVAQTALEDKTRGRVRLSFSYSTEKELFSVCVHKADRLVPDSTKGHCDPYVKWCVCVCVCVCVSVCAWVCAGESWREREGECVCVWEREGGREGVTCRGRD